MRLTKYAPLFLVAAAFLGCRDDSNVLTDPSELTPLTDEQKAELKKMDDAINAEESTAGGTGVVPKKKGRQRK